MIALDGSCEIAVDRQSLMSHFSLHKSTKNSEHGKMFNISFEEFLVLSENYPYFCRTI